MSTLDGLTADDVRRIEARARRLCLRLLHPELRAVWDAQDLVSHVFLSILEGRRHWPAERVGLEQFVLKSIRGIVGHLNKRHAKEQEARLRHVGASGGADLEKHAMARELLASVRLNSVRALEDRLVLEALELGMSRMETATAAGLSDREVDAARKRIRRRARSRASSRHQRHHPDPDPSSD